MAIDIKMKLEGDDRSFLRGSFQTANKTNTFPNTITGDITIDRTALIAESGLTFSKPNHASCKACSLVMFQKPKWPTTAAILAVKGYLCTAN